MNEIFLVNRSNHVAAQLIPGKEIKIRDQWMLDLISSTGITVSREFKDKFDCEWQVYPTDDRSLFAQAFEKIYFKHGLQQQGYCWKKKEEIES